MGYGRVWGPEEGAYPASTSGVADPLRPSSQNTQPARPGPSLPQYTPKRTRDCIALLFGEHEITK